MNFDVWRLNRNRQIMCIFEDTVLWYIDLPKKRKQRVLDKLKAKIIYFSWVLYDSWKHALWVCPFRGAAACPTLIYSAFGSLIAEHEAFWTKCQGAQVIPWVEEFKSKLNSKSAKSYFCWIDYGIKQHRVFSVSFVCVHSKWRFAHNELEQLVKN